MSECVRECCENDNISGKACAVREACFEVDCALRNPSGLPARGL